MDVDVDRGTLKSGYDADIHMGATCRICRGEASEENPLFHPCKCKGSIKYIHESCLMEWISSKNIDISKPGTTATCDICHYPINFSTTYAENMPDRIPMSLLLRRSMISCFHFIKDGLTLNLAAVLFLFGIPLTWNFFGKLYTIILDGELPYKGDFHKSIAYGYRDDVSDNTSLLLQYTLNYRFSILQILMVVILHISLYFQYDMIVRESVMGKMILHKIGPQFTKEELIKIQLKERFPMMDEQTIEHVARLMKARDEVTQQPDNQEAAQSEDEEDNENNEIAQETGSDNDEEETTNASATNLQDNLISDSDSNGGEVDDEEPEDELVNNAMDINDTDIPFQRPFDAFRNRQAQNEFDNLIDQQNELANGQPINIVNPNDEDIGEDRLMNEEVEDEMNQPVPPPIVINLKLKLTNVLAYYIVAEVVIAAYLAVAYLLPTVVGFGLLKILIFFGRIFGHGLAQLYYLFQLQRPYHFALRNIPYFEQIASGISSNIVDTWIYYYDGYTNNSLRSSMLVRSLPALVSYIATITLISIASEVICKGYGRERGMKNRTRRFLFQILFAIKCTFKVFTLFFIELAGFPVLAGLMLDFSIFAPLLNPGKQLWAPQICTAWPPLIFFIYWTIGTLYMYWFAKYIGMIRQHIIRPGVLFFIRSPDDPNIKILHDSLIHPMSIQISRLCLSMFIYAVFIIVGFGFHTRFLFPVLLNSKLLTTNNFISFWAPMIYVIPFYITKQIVESKPSVKLYIRKYWERAFDVSARKLRLSSFILGHDIPIERGHVHYRNFFYRYFAKHKAELSNPQLFTCPKTLDQVKQLFKEDRNVHAYFIPNGILMRVPSSDIVSRNYVQTLFVPVTKDDKLLRPLDLEVIKARNKRNAGDFGYLDEQNTEFDSYSIVYTPPNFRTRYLLLLVFVWLFASLLVLLTTLLCQYVVTAILAVILVPIAGLLPNTHFGYEASKHFIKTKFQQLDIFFVCAGAVILSVLLEKYHAYKMSRINLADHIIPVVNEGLDEPEHNDNNLLERAPAPRARDMRATIEHFLNHGETKFVVYVVCMLAVMSIRHVTLSFNLRSLRTFGLGYVSRKHFREFEVIFSPARILNGRFEELAILFLENLTTLYIGRKAASNRHRPFLTWFKIISEDLLGQLSFILYTTMPLVLSWVFFSSLEYLLHSDHYTSFGAPMRFLWRYRLLPQSNDIQWTIPQHMCFLSLYVIMSSYIVWQGVSAAKKWFGVAMQNVKDEVYAKGRSLQNFSGSDD
ncbi:hypothetical protein HG536_0C04460 [Torulaspora globosa]|uniref:RING-type E3 ubiquitin transferase n=1 Tax=Torulaspora globosa TaxID=48254 RepID=A0A7G3ZFJ1_9SACH|nr:uncharacterized protein HG536_0C04460 [Torulaspora globosa]QLL32277.1 hypothetical protein HG536_0C04460 [Torulaspora globosa]